MASRWLHDNQLLRLRSDTENTVALSALEMPSKPGKGDEKEIAPVSSTPKLPSKVPLQESTPILQSMTPLKNFNP